jgi:hypothetical protein
MRPGRTVKGEQVSATMAMATVVHTLFCLSCTFRLFNSVANTSWGLENRKNIENERLEELRSLAVSNNWRQQYSKVRALLETTKLSCLKEKNVPLDKKKTQLIHEEIIP